MTAMDYIKSLNLPIATGYKDDGWYSLGEAKVRISEDWFVYLSSSFGTASLYTANTTQASEFKALCKIYRVELPHDPAEVFDGHSPVVDAVTECFACGFINDEQGVCTRDGCCDSH